MNLIDLLGENDCKIMAGYFQKHNVEKDLLEEYYSVVLIPVDAVLKFMAKNLNIDVYDLVQLKTFKDIISNHIGEIISEDEFESQNSNIFPLTSDEHGNTYIDGAIFTSLIIEGYSTTYAKLRGVLSTKEQVAKLKIEIGTPKAINDDKITSLPDDVIETSIIPNLPVKDFTRLCKTSKKFARICLRSEDRIWQRFLVRDYPEITREILMEKTEYYHFLENVDFKNMSPKELYEYISKHFIKDIYKLPLFVTNNAYDIAHKTHTIMRKEKIFFINLVSNKDMKIVSIEWSLYPTADTIGMYQLRSPGFSSMTIGQNKIDRIIEKELLDNGYYAVIGYFSNDDIILFSDNMGITEDKTYLDITNTLEKLRINNNYV